MSKKHSQTNIARFDAEAAGWDDEPRRVELANALAASLLGQMHLTPGITALEFGCGTGLLTLQLAPKVKRVVAVDSSAGMLEVLRRKIEAQQISNVEPLLTDLLHEPPPDQRFDLLYTAMTLHHIDKVERLLQIFAGLLRPGGLLAIADLDKEPGHFHEDAAGVAHHGFERTALRHQLEQTGFAAVRAVTAHHIQKTGKDGVERRYPVFWMTAQRKE